MPDLFPNTREHRADAGGAEIFARIGGSGPPLLLLHGYPQTHAMWHAIARFLGVGLHSVCRLRVRQCHESSEVLLTGEGNGRRLGPLKRLLRVDLVLECVAGGGVPVLIAGIALGTAARLVSPHGAAAPRGHA